MKRHLRDAIAAAESCGLTVVSVEQNKHFRMRVRSAAGTEATIILPTSRSDNTRGAKNMIAFMRRVAAGETGRPQHARNGGSA